MRVGIMIFFSRSFVVAVQRSLEIRVHCLPRGSRITTLDRLEDRRVFPKRERHGIRKEWHFGNPSCKLAAYHRHQIDLLSGSVRDSARLPHSDDEWQGRILQSFREGGASSGSAPNEEFGFGPSSSTM